MPIIQAATPDSISFLLKYRLGRLTMTCEMIISLITCVATIIGTVIALLSYLKKKDKE